MPVDPLLLSIGKRMAEKRLACAHEQTLITQHTRLINMTAFVSCSFADPRSFVLYRKQKPTKTTTIRRSSTRQQGVFSSFLPSDPVTSFWPDQNIRDCFILSMRKKARALLFISIALSCPFFCPALYGTR